MEVAFAVALEAENEGEESLWCIAATVKVGAVHFFFLLKYWQ